MNQEILINKLLKSGKIIVFDGFHGLELYKSNEQHKETITKTLQDFLKKKKIEEIYVWADRKDLVLANAFTKSFTDYGYSNKHTQYTKEPLEFLNELRNKLKITNNDIIFIGNDPEMLAYLEIEGDYETHTTELFK